MLHFAEQEVILTLFFSKLFYISYNLHDGPFIKHGEKETLSSSLSHIYVYSLWYMLGTDKKSQ